MNQATDTSPRDIRQHLRDAIKHFEHVLPGQAPIRDFVHHNTLHGYQHMEFHEALKAARELTGAHGYLSQERFRGHYESGRITDNDLNSVIEADDSLEASTVLLHATGGPVTRRDVIRTALVQPLKQGN